ncbi:hypothetical protein WG907_12975 [Sphingobium sp. AN558]|uniref:hypothetical protein n=1 Tax=Sphingobium sp. AN558 TaxID=3133442 RepID=UPI0030C3B2A1
MSAAQTSLRLAILSTLCCAASPALAKAAPDPYVPAGKAVNCIQTSTIRSTNVRDDRTIDFVTGASRIYRNTLPNSCPSLGFEKRFLYKTSISQLCSVDIITVLQGGPGLSRGASCGLGKFQPMQKTPK